MVTQSKFGLTAVLIILLIIISLIIAMVIFSLPSSLDLCENLDLKCEEHEVECETARSLTDKNICLSTRSLCERVVSSCKLSGGKGRETVNSVAKMEKILILVQEIIQ